MKLLFALLAIIVIFGMSVHHISNIEKQNDSLIRKNELLEERHELSIDVGEAVGRYALYIHLKETSQIGDSIFVDVKRWNTICDSLETVK